MALKDPGAVHPFPLAAAFDATGLGQMHFVFYQAEEKTEFLERIKRLEPKAIFFGDPHSVFPIEIRFGLREIASLISLSTDTAGHNEKRNAALCSQEDYESVDLNVSFDGIVSPVMDLMTVTPVDYRNFQGDLQRDIRCGFSGSVPSPQKTPKFIEKVKSPRAMILEGLKACSSVTIQLNTQGQTFIEYARFMLRCKLSVNTSHSGYGRWIHRPCRHPDGWVGGILSDIKFDIHHLKGRVLEAGWAGCCLLESAGSPIANWFPEGSYYIYHNTDELKHLVNTLTDGEISTTAENLGIYTRAHYHPRRIYQGILGARRDPA